MLHCALGERGVVSPPTPVLVTGYYEPLLAARRTRSPRFRHPIYAPPAQGAARPAAGKSSDAPAAPGGPARVRGVVASGGSPSRAAIEAGALAGGGLELYWTDDPIELFFLHVQGSGRLALDDGTQARIGFAGSNELPYRSIGALLVERGELTLEQADAPGIKAWLRAHPDRAPEVLQHNPRYVYFRALDAPPGQGPPGALGVPLVPWLSVAVDPQVTPLGSIGLLRTQLPDGQELAELVIAMDTGAAIRGPGRIDLFLGTGQQAEQLAGLLRSPGEIAWLEPCAPGASFSGAPCSKD